MGFRDKLLMQVGRSISSSANELQGLRGAPASIFMSRTLPGGQQVRSCEGQPSVDAQPVSVLPALCPAHLASSSGDQQTSAGQYLLGVLGLGLSLSLGIGASSAWCDAAQVAETLEHEHHHPHLQKENDGGESEGKGEHEGKAHERDLSPPEPTGESALAKPQSDWGFSLMNQSVRRRIFFYYEKRIRTRSPPEKVFEYFASIDDKGTETLMTPGDLMRAVVPVFPPSDSPYARTGSLSGEPSQGILRCPESKLFKLFDTDGDGLISFPEYIFFVTLLSIPPGEVEQTFREFDLDDSGMVDKEEFKDVMAVLRKHTKVGRSNRGGLRFLSGKKPPRLGQDVNEGGVVQYFFGADGKGLLSLETFQKFIADLQEEITRLEFAHYDFRNEGSVSAQDFALSMVAAADMEHLTPLMARVEQLAKEEAFKDVRIRYDDFWAFAHCRWVVPRLENALQGFLAHSPEGVDGLTREEFREAVREVCGVSFDDVTLDLIFLIFDIDGNNRISAEEFLIAADCKDLQERNWAPLKWVKSWTGFS